MRMHWETTLKFPKLFTARGHHIAWLLHDTAHSISTDYLQLIVARRLIAITITSIRKGRDARYLQLVSNFQSILEMSVAMISVEVQNKLKDSTVLVLWGPGTKPEDVQSFTQGLTTHSCNRVVVEHFERLVMCKLLITHCNINKSSTLLLFLKILLPFCLNLYSSPPKLNFWCGSFKFIWTLFNISFIWAPIWNYQVLFVLFFIVYHELYWVLHMFWLAWIKWTCTETFVICLFLRINMVYYQ